MIYLNIIFYVLYNEEFWNMLKKFIIFLFKKKKLIIYRVYYNIEFLILWIILIYVLIKCLGIREY